MARNYTTHEIAGARESDSEHAEPTDSVQAYLAQRMNLNAFGDALSLMEWAREEATKVEKVDMAYDKDGDSDGDTSDFVISDRDKKVVTENERKPVATVSARFNPTQHEDVMDAVTAVLRDFNLHRSVVGEARDFESMASVDLFFANEATMHEWPNGTVVGAIELRNAHNGKESTRFRPVFIDVKTMTPLRFADWEKARHVKPEDDEKKEMYHDFYEKVAKVLFKLGYMEGYKNKVKKAAETKIDFSSKPITVQEYYETWLPSNTPQTVIETAVERAHVEGELMGSTSSSVPNGATLSVWDLMMGYAYALEHASSMTDETKDRFDSKIRKAIANPSKHIQEVIRDYAADELDTDEMAAQLERALEQASS